MTTYKGKISLPFCWKELLALESLEGCQRASTSRGKTVNGAVGEAQAYRDECREIDLTFDDGTLCSFELMSGDANYWFIIQVFDKGGSLLFETEPSFSICELEIAANDKVRCEIEVSFDWVEPEDIDEKEPNGDLWQDDTVQFPRLLAEIRAAGLTLDQYAFLQGSMDLQIGDIDEVLERAESEWERLKLVNCPPRSA